MSQNLGIGKVLILKWQPFQLLTKFEKRPSCLHLKKMQYFPKHYSYKNSTNTIENTWYNNEYLIIIKVDINFILRIAKAKEQLIK